MGDHMIWRNGIDSFLSGYGPVTAFKAYIFYLESYKRRNAWEHRHMGDYNGEIIPGLNALSTTSWRRAREWRYSSTILDIGTRWGRMISFTPLPSLPLEKHPSVYFVQEATWAVEWNAEFSVAQALGYQLYPMKYSGSYVGMQYWTSILKTSGKQNLRARRKRRWIKRE
jgi:hypothetical protein